MRFWRTLTITLLASVFIIPDAKAVSSPSAPIGASIQGTLFDTNGQPLLARYVAFTLQVLNQDGSCVLYEETHNDVDLSTTNGRFAITLGGGDTRSNKIDNSTELKLNVFRNDQTLAAVSGCAPNLTFTPGDARRIRLTFDKGSGPVRLDPDLDLRSSPYSSVASTLAGKGPEEFLQVRSDMDFHLSQENLEFAFSSTNYPRLEALLNGTSTSYLPYSPGTPVSLNGQRLTNLAAPTQSTDGVNKNYADTYIGGKIADLTGLTQDNMTLVWNATTQKWEAKTAPSSVINLTGDVTAYGTGAVAVTINPNAVTTEKIANDAITSAKINSTNIAINRLLITGGTTGELVKYATCDINEVLAWSALGWVCKPVSALAPVTSVAGKSGAVSLNINDIDGWRSAALRDVGVAANNVIALDSSARIPAVDGSLIENINAKQLQGKLVSAEVPNLNQVLGWNGSQWEPVSISSSITALTGDVSAMGSGSVASTVNSVGGVTAANVASGANLANAATNANTASAIVKRDASGNFTAGTAALTSASVGNVVYKDSGANSVTVQAPTTVTSSYTLKWPAAIGSANQVLTTDATGNLSWTSPLVNALTNANIWVGNSSNVPTAVAPSGDVTMNNAGVFSLKTTGTAGSYFKVTTDAQGRVTSGNASLVAADIPSLDWSKITSGKPTTLTGYGITDSLVNNLGGTPGIATGLDNAYPSSPVAGTIYFATDSKTIYQYNSGSWTPMAQSTGGAPGGSASGDLSGTYPGPTVAKIRGVTVNATAPADKQILIYNSTSSQWVPVSLSGDVTTTNSGAMTVAAVGTSTAANIHNAELLANAATNANTVSTIVKRDASGNFSAGTITANLIGNVTGSATSFTGSLAGDVTGTQAATTVSKVNGGSIPASAALLASNGNSQFTALTTVPTSAMPAFTGDVTSTAGSLSLTLSNSGASAGTYSKVTVDAKGRVTAGANLATSDITGALGYTPVNQAGDTMLGALNLPTNGLTVGTNQLVVSSGKVGIGSATPASRLDVNGSVRVGADAAGCSPTNQSSIRANGTVLEYCNGSAWTTLSAGSGINQLTGDVTATGPGNVAATVAFVNGVTAANVASGANLANAATNANTASAIVKRDASGNFTAGTAALTSASVGNVVYKDSGANSVTVQAPTTVTSSYTLKWPAAIGSANQVLTTDATGNLSWTTPSPGGVTSVTAGTGLNVGAGPNGSITSTGTLNVDVGTTAGKIVQVASGDKLPVIDGSNLTNISVTKIQGYSVASTAPTSGKFLSYTGTQWAPSDILFSNIKNSMGNSAFNIGACAAYQTVAWSSLTDTFTCQNISSLNASTITAGTMDAARLPAAASGAAGIVSTATQTFDGDKTFSGAINVSGATTMNGTVVVVNGVKIGSTATTCNASTEGTMRYNTSAKRMEFCNGSSWSNLSSGTVANLTIGAPSVSVVKSGPVDFVVTYGSGTDTAQIFLSSGNISLGGTATTGCSISSVTGSGSTRTVRVDGCSGTGTVNISIAAGSANSTTNDPAPAAGPSSSYQADNTGPSAPTSVTLGSVPQNLTTSPTITYNAATDVGAAGIANHQVKILKTSDSSIALDWTNHTSGSSVASLSLAANTQYSVLVRAVDTVGNLGTQTAAVNWTTINDPCPTGYILVPALAGYSTLDFCVAKYEAKQSGSIAISQASGSPWVSINRDAAITACQANGAKYDLITNGEWQAIARNIELVASNWSSGVVGTGSINRGHSDNAPASALTAGTTDTDACNGTGQTCSDTVWDTQRRTHLLSNGKVIWDLAGNVWEWVKDNNSTNYGADAYISQITNSTTKSKFGPSGTYTSLNSGEYGGLGYGYTNYTAGAVLRGGNWANGTVSGVFHVNLSGAPTTTDTYLGFRCAYHP